MRPSVPIGFTLVGDPVASGLVKNLAEPEANVTGVFSLQTEPTAKRLEVLKTLVPGSDASGRSTTAAT